MHVPVLALALLFFGVPLVLLLGRIGVALFVASGLLGMLFGAPQAGAALLLGGLAATALAFALLPQGRAAWGVGLWAALVTLPTWAEPGAWAWMAWPPAALAGADWDPSLLPPLYARWGAGVPLPRVPYATICVVWALLALVAAVAARFAVMLPRGEDEPPTP